MKTADFERFVQTNWGKLGDKPIPENMSYEDLAAGYQELRDLFIMSTGLPGEVGETVEHLKKLVRNGTFDRNEFAKEAGDALHYLVRLITRFGFTLEEIMQINHDKLMQRAKERGWVKAMPNSTEDKAA